MRRGLAAVLVVAGLVAGCTKEQQEAPSKSVQRIEDKARTEATQLEERGQQLEDQVEP